MSYLTDNKALRLLLAPFASHIEKHESVVRALRDFRNANPANNNFPEYNTLSTIPSHLTTFRES